MAQPSYNITLVALFESKWRKLDKKPARRDKFAYNIDNLSGV